MARYEIGRCVTVRQIDGRIFSCPECHMSPWKLSHLLSSPSPVSAATFAPEDRQTNAVTTHKNVLKIVPKFTKKNTI